MAKGENVAVNGKNYKVLRWTQGTGRTVWVEFETKQWELLCVPVTQITLVGRGEVEPRECSRAVPTSQAGAGEFSCSLSFTPKRDEKFVF